MTIQARIEQGVAELGLALPAESASRMAAHVALVEKWNRVHNLTAVRDAQQMVGLHVLDSLSILPHLGTPASLVDVGTGPGFPGIPLAIACPEMKVALLDSSHKKCTFLEQARGELRLANATVVCERVEDWKPEAGFAAVVSRAFADLADFVAQARHLVAPGGRMYAMKGVHPYDELARVPDSHRVASVIELRVPGVDANRHLVVLEEA